MIDFNTVTEFEQTIAEFFGATEAVAVDCCTHGIELCLRLTQPRQVTCPEHTYISIPFTFEKLNLTHQFYSNIYTMAETPETLTLSRGKNLNLQFFI